MRIGLITISYFLLIGCASKGKEITPEVGPIAEAVYASGVVKAGEQYNVFASTGGILSTVLVHEGDSVHVGQPLFVIDDRAASLARRNAELALELSTRNAGEGSPVLKERELAVGIALEKLRSDSLMYVRQKNLWDQQIGSRTEFEQRELAFLTSRTNHANALAALEDTRARLRNELEMARNSYAKSQVGEGDFTVRSVVDGQVFDILIEPGELVTPQAPLAVVGRASGFILELQVDEHDIVRVRKGQRVLVSMDSYEGQVMEAEILQVDPILDQRSRTFTVKATFTNGPATLYPYLTAEANIILAQKPRTLTIPTSYLVDGSYVLTGKGERTEVVTGLHDLQRTEILSGIDSTTAILEP